MASDDHWMDDTYKRNSVFGQKRNDVASKGYTPATPPPAIIQEKRQAQSMTNTQMRLAALPKEYRAQQKSPQEIGQYSPGYFAQQQQNAPETNSQAYPASYSQQNSQPNYSQQNSQPNYSQQNSQPNYSQQNSQPNYGQANRPQANSQPNYAYPPGYGQPGHGAPPEHIQEQNHFQSQSTKFSQQFGQPEYSQEMSQPDYAQQQAQQYAQQQYAQQQYAQQQQQQQQLAQQQYAQQQQTAALQPQASELTVEEIDDRALYDSHTRAYNLRHTLRLLRSELVRAAYTNRSVSLLVVSIDRYDEILQDHTSVAVEKAVDAICRTLLQFCRPIDIVGRYMDRRFIVICPEMAESQAAELAEKIRAVCAAIVIAHNWKNIKLSASIGIASLSAECNDVESFIALADLGADMVTENGGNGVFFAAGAE